MTQKHSRQVNINNAANQLRQYSKPIIIKIYVIIYITPTNYEHDLMYKNDLHLS